MSLNLRQIEVFRAVITTGSISGAARLLAVSQPAVSRLLSYTETRLGFTLFERIKGRLYATPEARRLFRDVEQVYSSVRRVNETAQELAEQRTGLLHLVSSQSLGHQIMPLAIGRFRTAHADTKVTFRELRFEPLGQAVLAQQAELGVTILPVDHPNLDSEELAKGRLVCICPYDHPLAHGAMLSVADLRAWPLVSYPHGTPFGTMVEQLYARADEPLRVSIEVASPQNACSLVKAGAGVALVDEFSIKSRIPGDFVVRPIADAPTLSATLVYARYQPLSLLAQSFIAELRGVLVEQGFEVLRGRG